GTSARRRRRFPGYSSRARCSTASARASAGRRSIWAGWRRGSALRTRERRRRDSLIEAVAARERAASLADARYQAGAADFLASLVAQRTVLRLQIDLADSRTKTVTSLIAVYKALGGGWEIGEPGRKAGPAE